MRSFAIGVIFTFALAARADVVINEIHYHPPSDDDRQQFIELHNTAPQAIDISGWSFSRGVELTIPANTTIPANGYFVVAKSKTDFKKLYRFDANAEFAGRLSHDKERLELVDAAGKKVDEIRYGSRPPWPVAADGCGASLERICTTTKVSGATNWAPSPMAPFGKPSGSPGKANLNARPAPPTKVESVSHSPTSAAAGQPIDVIVRVDPRTALREATLLYRVVSSNQREAEKSLRMTVVGDGRLTASIPGQKAGWIVRYRIRVVYAAGAECITPHPNELRPAFSVLVAPSYEPAAIPICDILQIGEDGKVVWPRLMSFGFGSPPSAELPKRGAAAFVYVDPETKKPELFDYVNVTPRRGGHKIRFHPDRPLKGMSTVNVIFEYNDRFVLAEPLAYELYRRAQVAAPRTDFVRTTIDKQPLGYQLLVEQPNKSFLRHNGIHTGGHLYKANWMGGDPIHRHEKKTRLADGHRDLLESLDRINAKKGDEQWAVIEREMDVPKVVTHYACRTILSDWDGFFNNYYLYHDVGDTGKWTLYPWDQDKTWGFHDGIGGGNDVFVDMPITYGREGDRQISSAWWRYGGDLRRPLLANAKFRLFFLRRVHELLQNVYTEPVFFPVIEQLGKRLTPEVEHRAKLRRENPQAAAMQLQRHLDSLRNHLVKRRAFLLAQPELQAAVAHAR